jgi:hypothetical protein
MTEDLTGAGIMIMTEARTAQAMTLETAMGDMTERKAIHNMGNMGKRSPIMNIAIPIGTMTPGIMNGVMKKSIITPIPDMRRFQHGALLPVSELLALEVLASVVSEVQAWDGLVTARPTTRLVITTIGRPIILP